MASVTFPVALGGDGSTVTDDANADTGLANGGHRARFVASLAQAVAVMSGAVSQTTTKASAADDAATRAAASAASAVSSPGTNCTSSTTLSVSVGSKSLVVQTGKSIVAGMAVMIANSASPSTQYMHGIVASYTPATGALIVTADLSYGTGSASSWNVSLSAPLYINNGLSNTQTISANLALAPNAPRLQRITASAPVDVILPDATAITTGIDILKLSNRGNISLGVSDNTGTLLGFVRAGDVAGFHLADNATAAGVWDAELNGAILDIADVAYSTPQATGFGNSTIYGKFHTAMLSATLGLAAYINSSGGLSCAPVDLTTGAIGTPNAATASGSDSKGFALFPLSATTALLIYNNTYMVVVSVSGSTISYGTPVALSTSYGLLNSGASGATPNIIKLSSTLFLTVGGWGGSPVITAITISGTVITQATTTVASIAEVWQAYYGWVALSATTALLTLTDSVGNTAPHTNRTLVVSVSAGAPTAGTPISRSVNYPQLAQSILPQSATKALQLLSVGTSYYARVLTISGMTVTSGSERTVRSDTTEGVFGGGAMKSSASNAQAYTCTSMAAEEGCCWLGGNSYLVLGKTDTVDILTADFTANTVAAPASYTLTGSNAMLTDTGYLLRFASTATQLTINRAQLSASGLTPLAANTLPLRLATGMTPTIGKNVHWLVGSAPSTNQLAWTVTINDAGNIIASTSYASGNQATALRTSSWAGGFTIGSRNWAIQNAIGNNNFIEVVRLK